MTGGVRFVTMGDMLSHMNNPTTVDPCVITGESGNATLHRLQPCDETWPDGTVVLGTVSEPCGPGETFTPANREQGLDACVASTPAPFAAAPAELPATGVEHMLMIVVAVVLVTVGGTLSRVRR